MLITVVRTYFTDQSTCGELYIDQPLSLPIFCYTLELPKPRCIPAGTYKMILERSPRLGYVTPRLLSVPGWPNNDVLIHILNTPEETEGCIGVGMTHETDFIGESRSAFNALMAKFGPPASAGDLFITVIG